MTMKNRTSDLHVKAAFRPVFLALRKDIRRHEGGLIALAAEMGRTGPNANNILSNRFNPDDLTHQPTLRDFLDAIETLPALHTINALMSYALMDFSAEAMTDEGRAAFCLSKIGELADVIRAKSEAVADGKVDRREHREIANLLRPLLPELTAFCDAVEE